MGITMDRRSLLQSAAAGAGVVALGPLAFADPADATAVAPTAAADFTGSGRWDTGRHLRLASIERAFGAPMPRHRNNGEERSLPGYIGNYSKGLPHDDLGEVDPAAYDALRRAVRTGDPSDWERIPRGRPDARRQLGPVGALAFNLQGPDPVSTVVPPAPLTSGAQLAAEMAELYWIALLRDVPFSHYDSSPLVAEAAADLSTYTGYRGPKENGRVTPGTLFRDHTPGAVTGPFVSQFLLRDINYGTTHLPYRHDTVAPGVDYGLTLSEAVEIQRGMPVTTPRDLVDTRYLRTARDLGHYTHFDGLPYQPYVYAALILQSLPGYPDELLDRGNPYLASANQVGFTAFGTPHLMTLITDVGCLAIKHTIYQQFHVHRRLRPEAMGLRIHVQLERDPGRYDGLISSEILESAVVDRVRSTYGTTLLPLGFPEGSPMSPAYHSGHCTIAGACVTMLKAWVDESAVIPDPVVPNDDGTALVPYTGPELTVGGELDKLASNIGAGRMFGSTHYRSDDERGYRAGEAIALAMLRDQADLYAEDATFAVTRFDGTTVTI
jgi:hypothetical protein